MWKSQTTSNSTAFTRKNLTRKKITTKEEERKSKHIQKPCEEICSHNKRRRKTMKTDNNMFARQVQRMYLSQAEIKQK